MSCLLSNTSSVQISCHLVSTRKLSPCQWRRITIQSMRYIFRINILVDLFSKQLCYAAEWLFIRTIYIRAHNIAKLINEIGRRSLVRHVLSPRSISIATSKRDRYVISCRLSSTESHSSWQVSSLPIPNS